MSMFGPLLSIAVQHEYYGGVCKDFEFVVPSDTAAMLRNGRVVTRVHNGRFYLLCEQESPGVPQIPLTGRHVRIGMRLRNTAFSNFTDLGGISNSAVRVYRNTLQDDVLDAPAPYRLVGRSLSHPLSTTDRPLPVLLKDDHDIILGGDIFETGNVRDTYTEDISLFAPGIYQIEEDTSGGTIETDYYFHPDFHRQGVFCIVDLQIADGFYTTPPAFEIPFTARSDVLKYYVVASNYSDGDVNQLSVTDTGFSDGGWTKINFDKIGSGAFATDDIPAELLLGSNTDAKVVLFKSTAPVARRVDARSKIQLKKQNDVLVGNLPAPSVDRPNADVIIQVSKT